MLAVGVLASATTPASAQGNDLPCPLRTLHGGAAAAQLGSSVCIVGTPFDGTPFDGAPFDGAPFDGTPFDGTPSDGVMFAVGAPGSDTVLFGSTETGRVFASIVGPPGTRFGHALAVLDGQWFIGAPDDAPSGAVHRVTLESGSAEPLPVLWETIRPVGANSGARAGWSLAAAGDRLCVGVPWLGQVLPGSGTSPVGAVDLYRWDGQVLVADGRLLPPSGETETGFAEALATDGLHLAVGAPRGSGPSPECGVVDLYRFVEGAVNGSGLPGAARIARLVIPDGATDDAAGAALAFGGGAASSGAADLAIGAPYHAPPPISGTSPSPSTGTVHLLPAAEIAALPSSPTSVPVLTVPASLARATGAVGFGSALAFDGTSWWVATPADGLEAPLAGAITGFHPAPEGSAGWVEGATLRAPIPAPGAELGSALAASPTVLIAGAPGDPVGCGGPFGCDAGALVVWVTAGGRDCDGDGLPDPCAIAEDPTLDLDDDGRLDRCAFRRGDAARDGQLTIADAIVLLHGLLGAGPDPIPLECPASWDTNADDSLDLADPISLLAHLFAGGPPVPPPVGECGVVAGALPCPVECAP